MPVNREERMISAIRLIAPCMLACAAFSAEAADVTGRWTATVPTAAGPKNYTYVFRQDGADVIGTVNSQDGVVAIASGSINYKTITFIENVTTAGGRVVLEYTGELKSDNEIRFKRQAAGASYSVQFVATRVGSP
jgi:hypothetical protein